MFDKWAIDYELWIWTYFNLLSAYKSVNKNTYES